MKKTGIGCGIAAIVLIIFLALTGGIYTVHETEQVIVTQFGKPVGDPVTDPGLKFKIPFLQTANVFDKRILEWDGDVTEMPTLDRTFIQVDTYARWAIADPLAYFEALRDERTARSRLDDILGSAVRSSVAKHELIEVIRTTKDRKPEVQDELAEADMTGEVGAILPIRRGRRALEDDILKEAKGKLEELGIALLDIRFKRINYSREVQERIYERMISERQQIAERFRSEGAGEAAKILGDMERDLREIESEAYKKVEEIKGKADAEATEIYAKSYNQTPEAAEFYEFVRTLELYKTMLGDSTVVLSTDSDLFKYLKSVKPIGPSSSVDAVMQAEGEGATRKAPVQRKPAPKDPNN